MLVEDIIGFHQHIINTTAKGSEIFGWQCEYSNPE